MRQGLVKRRVRAISYATNQKKKKKKEKKKENASSPHVTSSCLLITVLPKQLTLVIIYNSVVASPSREAVPGCKPSFATQTAPATPSAAGTTQQAHLLGGALSHAPEAGCYHRQRNHNRDDRAEDDDWILDPGLVGLKYRVALFAQADLAKLAAPVAVDVPADCCCNANGHDDGEEEGDARDAVLLVELFLVALAWVHIPKLVHGALVVHTGRQRDAAVATGVVVFDSIRVFLAPERWILGLQTGNQLALTVVVEFKVEVTTRIMSVLVPLKEGKGWGTVD